MKTTKGIRIGMSLVFVASLLLCGFWCEHSASAAQISKVVAEESQKPTLSNGIPGMEGADVFVSEEWLNTVTAQAGDGDIITAVKSSQLNVPHNWEVVIDDRTIKVTITNENGIENATVMLQICRNDDQNTEVVQKWGSLSGQSGNVTVDLSDATTYSDGTYTIILYEDIKNDGQVWSIASYYIQIVDGVISFAPGGASSIEQAFIDNLNKNYNPDLYDEIPLKYYPEEANTIYKYYAADNLDEMIAKAKELTAKCTSDEQKVKAIHDWVCEEFAYDYVALNSGNYDDQADAEWVFDNKLAVCSGFSRMCQILFTSVGIPCMNVVGYADGNGIASSDVTNESNHEWNVVYLNGSWRILDVTWDCENRYYGSGNEETTLGNAPSYTYYGIIPFCYGITHCSQELPGESYENIEGPYFTDYYVEKITLQNTPTAKFNLNDTFAGSYRLLCELSDGSTLTRTVDGTICAEGYDMTKNGYQMLTVSYGGRNLKYEILVGTGCTGNHVITEWIVLEKANCTSLGLKSANCTNCNKYHEDVASATPVHNVQDEIVTKEPTCTTEGKKQGVCKDCGETVTTSIDVVNHVYAENFTTDRETSCTAVGSKSRHCQWYDECNMVTEQTDIPMIDHEYDTEFTVDKEATCTTNGSKSKHCKVCDSKTDMTAIQAAGHVAGEWIVDKEPTYEESGSRHKECSVCHALVESESIDKLVAKKGATVAVGGANYSISSSSAGKNTVTYAGPQDKSVQTVSVPSSIQIGTKTYKVTTISANAFANCKQLKTVKLGSNVTTIGKNAFSGCTKLSKITLPSKLIVIESSAFANCTSLKSITIPASVKKIGSKAFYKCKNLRKITIKTSKLKSSTVGKNAFTGVNQKVKVKVPKKKLKEYKKFLKKKGLPKKATIKK